MAGRLRRLGRRLFSLELSLGGAFVSVVLLTSLLLGSALYLSMRTFIRNDLRATLRNAAGVAALQIDPRDHRSIRTKADEAGPQYARIRGQLEAIRSRSRAIRYIYTLRRDEQGRILFVVDADTNAATVSHVGDVYPKPTPAMLQVFEKPYGAHVDKDFVTDQWGAFITGYAPILDPKGEAIGALGMDLSAEDAAAFERKFLLLALALFAVISLIVVAVGLALSRRISQPLTDLALDMSHIQNFDLDSDIEIDTRIREVADMKDSLDNMKKGLRSFKRYVPADLVSELIKLGQEAHLGAENRALTVLFSDIKDFTTLSEAMPPAKLAESLGVYFEGMTRAILEEGGTVDKFIGDAIMAFWGAPHAMDDHAARACRAALRCQEFLSRRFGQGRREDEPSFMTRIGVHTGTAYVGNFGYPERLSYTAIGDDVNLASRLEGLNKMYGTRLLVSETTLAAVGGAFVTRPVDRVAVKGKSHGVTIHELIGEASRVPSETARRARRFAEAFASYQGRRWAEAEALFRKLAQESPDDAAAGTLAQRCAEFAAHPPAADWDGSLALHSK